ncbi:hypothetical protein Gpo141_00000876 [Globisporangium polare]
MAICDSDDAVTAAAYALADEKKLQEPPVPRRSLRERVSSACARVTCDFKWLRCLGSFCWSMPLLFASPSLVVAWYVYVPFFVDVATMNTKYAFDSPSQSGYNGYGTAMLIVLPFIVLSTAFIPCGGPERAVRWGLYITAVIYAILLIIGNSLGAGQVEKRLALAPEFASKFNSYYCESRTLRVCLEGSQDELLVLMHGNGTTLAGASANATNDQAAIAVWTQCRKVIVATTARAQRGENDSPGDKKLELGPIYKFLDDSGTSNQVDVWCGNLLHRTTELSDAEQRSLPSPFAANVAMFHKFTKEWARRLFYSNVLLGTAIGCLMLGAWSFKVNNHFDPDGW